MADGPSITVAWAIPIEAQLFGARLEAYARSKAVKHTFWLCIQHAHTDQALAKVPPEVFKMIASQIQQHIFDRRQKWWQDAVRCCSLVCDDDCRGNDEHEERVCELLSKVGLRRPPCQVLEKVNFDKCRQVHK